MQLILTSIDADKKIQAIKNIRAATGIGLYNAKVAADTVIQNQGFAAYKGYTLAQGLTPEKAEAGLKALTDRHYCEAHIETEHLDSERVEAEIDTILLLADAIQIARDQPGLSISAVIRLAQK